MSDTVLHTLTYPPSPSPRFALWKLNEAAETCRTHGDVRNCHAAPCHAMPMYVCMRDAQKVIRLLNLARLPDVDGLLRCW